MRHPEPEQLMLLMRDGSAGADPSLVEHVRSCARCEAELAVVTHTVTLAREGRDGLAAPSRPPERVWERINAELGEAGELSTGRASTPRPHRRGWWQLAAAVVLGAVLGATTVVAVDRMSGEPESAGPRPLATAALDTVGPVTGTGTGTASLVVDGPVTRLQLQVALPPSAGFYEVWLADATLEHMYSLGVLNADGAGSFVVPAGVQLSAFVTVDVSAEELDGDPAHSARSVLRGTLA